MFCAVRCPTPQVNGRLRELHTTLEAGDRLREGVLQGMALNLDAWSIQVGENRRLGEPQVDGRVLGRVSLVLGGGAGHGWRSTMTHAPSGRGLRLHALVAGRHSWAHARGRPAHVAWFAACTALGGPAAITVGCCLPALAQVRREKGIYHTLNKLSMDVTRKVGAVTAV